MEQFCGFKMYELEIKINAEIKILKGGENMTRNLVDCLRKLKVRLLSVYGEQ